MDKLPIIITGAGGFTIGVVMGWKAAIYCVKTYISSDEFHKKLEKKAESAVGDLLNDFYNRVKEHQNKEES